MLIILEGPDGTGKTSLAQRLVAQLAAKAPRALVELWHRGAPSPSSHPLDEYVIPLLGYSPGTDHHIICDRWHIGEWVYPRVLGRPSKMDDPVFHYVEAFLRSRGAVVYWPFTRVGEMERRLTALGKDGDVIPHLSALQYRYHEAPTQLRVDFETFTPDRLFDAAHYEEVRAKTFRTLTTPVGDPWPRGLVLGDVRHEHRKDPTGPVARADLRPAFMPYPATSGHYLFHDPLHNTAYANACDVDSVVKMVSILRPKKILTLGVHAHKALADLGIDHGAVPHPQYVRRFHHRHREAYHTLIRSTLESEEDNLSWRP